VKTLKECFENERDFDVAMYELGAMLGFWPEVDWQNRESWLQYNERKWIFWSNNPVGNHLSKMLEELVEMGALIKCGKDELGIKANEAFIPDAVGPSEDSEAETGFVDQEAGSHIIPKVKL
jgi:hypothetical protein